MGREYLDNAEAVGDLRRSTLADYRYCMEARVLRAPELVDKPLVDITPRDFLAAVLMGGSFRRRPRNIAEASRVDEFRDWCQTKTA